MLTTQKNVTQNMKKLRQPIPSNVLSSVKLKSLSAFLQLNSIFFASTNITLCC